MKTNIIKLLVVILTTFLWTGCEDYLSIEPKSSLATETVFATEAGADLFLNDVYVALPNPESGAPNGQRAGGPGYAYDNWEWMSPYNICKFNWGRTSILVQDFSYTASQRGNPSPYNHSYPAVPFIYDFLVQYIRNANFFIESVEKNIGNFSSEWAEKRIAEAKCLRAYYYHQLWMNYGGVPLITKVLDQKTMGDDIFQPSASQEEMFLFMQKDLADAAEVLPDEVGNGRFTKGGALVLKAWIELYWADIVKDPRPASLFPADQTKATSLYQQCAATCKEIMDLGTYDLMPTRVAAFEEKNNNCKEHIFAYQTEGTLRRSNRSNRFGPVNPAIGNQGNVGQGAPTQGMVDMFGMANGLPIDDPNSGYDPERPFLNREPRFYQDIVYDSCYFTGRLFTFNPNTAAGDVTLIPNDGVRTGYFRRKGINESLNSSTFGQEAANFLFFRYADVLLMYAEAKVKAADLGGPAVDQSVIDAIDMIRMRPATDNDNGLPSLTTTYGGTPSLEQLMELIWTERIVELSFEFKAYNDVRRWRKAGELLTVPKMGLRWNAEQNEYENLELYPTGWPGDYCYLMPVYTGWIERNPSWMDPANQVDGRTAGQNPGW